MSPRNPYQAQFDALPETAHRVIAGGADTAYWEYGDPRSPRVIVVVHGFRGDHHGLVPILAHLPGYRMIAPDLPGFGASPAFAGAHSLDAYRDWLTAFVAALELPEPPIILGHSFGSIVVAATVAAGLPVSETILINPIAAPALRGPRGVLTRLAVFYYWAGKHLPERLGFALLRSAVVTRVTSITMAKTRDRELRAWIHDQHDRYFSDFADRDSVMGGFTTSVSHDVTESVPGLRGPVLLIAAERDDITAVPAQRALAAALPHARLEVIPAVGHLVHYETPAQAAAIIRDELESPRA